jgi:hypothetical protein
MLGLFSATPDHPLATAKEARRIAADIARQPPAKAVSEATDWFESLAGIDDFAVALRFERCAELAIASLPHARRLARDYMHAPRQAGPQERQLWRFGHDYWLQLGRVLERCLADCDADPKSARAINSATLLTALLMAHGAQSRWLSLRYDPTPESLWERLGQAYLRAVRANVADSESQPFDAVAGVSSPAREYLKTLILHASATHSMLPAEMGLAERLLGRFLPQFALSSETAADAMLWIDAGKPMPPARLTQPAEASEGLRFVRPGAALPALRQLRDAATTARELPADLACVGLYARETALRVLDQLASNWSSTPPKRKNMRHEVSSRVAVVAGLAAVRRCLAGESDEAQACVDWQVVNISQGGISARLPLAHNGQIKVGMLVGYRPAGSQTWQIGAIRRLVRDNDLHATVGIEKLSKLPRAASFMDGGLQTEVILLDALRHGGTVPVLLEASHWEDGAALVALLDGLPWQLNADEKLEVGDDWMLGRCSVDLLAH